MAKKSFMENIELQRLKKENTSLQNKLSNSGTEKVDLKNKVVQLERILVDAPEVKTSGRIKYTEINLGNNIREEFDSEVIKELALSIFEKGQLQPVLLTSDNYLIAGYRRYNAIKLLNEPNAEVKSFIKDNFVPDYLLTHNLELKLADLSSEEVDELQFIENEERRSLDNFDISKLFCKYEELGLKQEEISKKFKKTKGFVSSLISLKKIEPEITKLLKEFQVYAWSKKKFIAMNFDKLTPEDEEFYQKNKVIIGWSTLYKIASQSSIEKQKETFLKIFKNRLHNDELNSEFFKLNKSEKEFVQEAAINKAIKQSSSLKKTIQEIVEKSDSKNSKTVNELVSYLDKIEQIFNKLKS